MTYSNEHANANYGPEDIPSAKNTDPRRCSCHPDDKPPQPCPRKFALSHCRIAALIAAATPFAVHDWMDAELEDDSCKLTKHSGPVTVGDWRALRAALAPLLESDWAARGGEGRES